MSSQLRFEQHSTYVPGLHPVDSVYKFGTTRLKILGSEKKFKYGVAAPHEIYHVFTWEMSDEHGFPKYSFFEDEDEITSDYLEENYEEAELYDTQGRRILVFPKRVVYRDIANILDASIIMLNLAPKHEEILGKIAQLGYGEFPKYKGCMDTRSPLRRDLEKFAIFGAQSDALKLIETEYLQSNWQSLVLACHYGTEMFHREIHKHNMVEYTDDNIWVYEDHLENGKMDYMFEMYELTQRYKQAMKIAPNKMEYSFSF